MGRASSSDHEPNGSLPSIDSFVQWLALDPVLAAAQRPVHLIIAKLAQVLHVDCVFVGELLDVVPERVRAVAWWKDGRHPQPIEYSVAGSPCEPAVRGRPSYCPLGVTRRYAQTDFQKAEGIEAYAAHPLTSLEGAPLGLISVMSRHRFTDRRRVEQVLAVSAPRLAGELSRLRATGDMRHVQSTGQTRLERPEQQLLEGVRERETLLREVHHRVTTAVDDSVREAPDAHFIAMIERLQTLLVDGHVWSVAGEQNASTGPHGLPVTSRELEIIRGLVCYRRLTMVADVLGISVHTARNHLKSVFRKLNLHSQDELLRFLLHGGGPGAT